MVSRPRPDTIHRNFDDLNLFDEIREEPEVPRAPAWRPARARPA